jgi:hypothetical protein
MVPYRDRNYFGATQRRTGADLLAVPVYEASPRRPRSHSDTRIPHDGDGISRNFTTLEVRPSSEVVSHQEIVSERVISQQRGSTHSKAEDQNTTRDRSGAPARPEAWSKSQCES